MIKHYKNLYFCNAFENAYLNYIYKNIILKLTSEFVEKIGQQKILMFLLTVSASYGGNGADYTGGNSKPKIQSKINIR